MRFDADSRPATFGGIDLTSYPHACAIVESTDDERKVVPPFISEGLAEGDFVFVSHGAGRGDLIAEWIGADSVALRERGQLEMKDSSETHLRSGDFSVEAMLELVDQVCARGVEQGYPRTRMVGYMDWSVDGRAGVADVLEYEARVNAVLARRGSPAICVYPLERLSARSLVGLMAVHPVVYVDGRTRVSPFFVEPSEFLARRYQG